MRGCDEERDATVAVVDGHQEGNDHGAGLQREAHAAVCELGQLAGQATAGSSDRDWGDCCWRVDESGLLWLDILVHLGLWDALRDWVSGRGVVFFWFVGHDLRGCGGLVSEMCE